MPLPEHSRIRRRDGGEWHKEESDEESARGRERGVAPSQNNNNSNSNHHSMANILANTWEYPNRNPLTSLNSYPEYSNSGLPIGDWINDENEAYNENINHGVQQNIEESTDSRREAQQLGLGINGPNNHEFSRTSIPTMHNELSPSILPNQLNMELQLEALKEFFEFRIAELKEQLEEYQSSQQFSRYYMIWLSILVYILICYQYFQYGLQYPINRWMKS